jgi:hypothetical protein
MIIIGMSTDDGGGMSRVENWKLTFEVHLNKLLTQPGCSYRLVAFPPEFIEVYISSRRIDFIFCSPSDFQRMRTKYQVRDLLSIRRSIGNFSNIDFFGGVIVRSVHKHTSILKLGDIAHNPGLRICGVFGSKFSGWEIQFYEMLKHEVDVMSMTNIEFMPTHDSSILAVMNNTCDIGLARTSTIEMIAGAATDVFSIGDRGAELGFGHMISTDLYPEWPVASLEHVPRMIQEIVVRGLLSITKTSLAASQAEYVGFALSHSYTSVAEMLIAIDDIGNGKCMPGEHRKGSNPGKCIACPAGTMSMTGIGACTECPMSTFSNETHSKTCTLCPSTTSTGMTGATTHTQCVPQKASFLILIVAVVSALAFLLLVGLVTYSCISLFKRWRALTHSVRQLKDNRLHRLRHAVGLMQTLRFPLVLMKLSVFKRLNHIEPYEIARDAGHLKFLDTWSESLEFSQLNPIIFNSHQWLSSRHPDPHGTHYAAIVAAGDNICALHGHIDVYLWVDYFSIPQQCPESKLNAISSLAGYTCFCKYFVVIAPDAINYDTQSLCDAVSYARRGWCRLEQWVFMRVNSAERMYLMNTDKLDNLSSDWLDQAVYVFEGDFSFEKDKHAIVDVVLGLYAFMLILKLYTEPDSRCFPDQYFDGLDVLLHDELSAGTFTYEELKGFMQIAPNDEINIIV